MPPSPKPLPLTFQTTYAELLEQCSVDAFNDAFSERGTFIPKDISGRRYWYFQLPASEGQKQRYVGPETPQLLEHIKQHRQAREAHRSQRSLVSTLLRTAGLPRPLPKIGKIVAGLANAGVFRLRGVLVGTVAYQTYPAMLGMRLPATALQTGDVDIAQFTNVSVAVDDATVPMIDVLKKVDESFTPIPHVHDGRRSVAYRAADGVRVDFLTPNTGPDSEKPRRLKALGTDAEPLRFLDFLIHDPEPSVVLHDAGIYVLVPAPERYAVHKLIVAQRRVGPHNSKRPKDLLQAEGLLDRLLEIRPERLREVCQEAEGRSAKWSRYLLDGLGEISPSVRDRVLALLRKTRSQVSQANLRFDTSAPRDDFARESVVIWAFDGAQRVQGIIPRSVIEDHYEGDSLNRSGRVRKVQENRAELERLLRKKYLLDPIEETGVVILKTLDVERLRAKRDQPTPTASRRSGNILHRAMKNKNAG